MKNHEVTTEQGDLTSADFWDDRYENLEKPSGVTSWLRGKAHWQFDSMLAYLLDSVSTNPMNILEIGCAPGNILESIHRLRPQHQLHGIDFVPHGVKMTQKRLSDAKIPAIIHQGDVRKFSPSQKYDMVISTGFVEHFSNPVEMLEHHARLASPNGHVVVTVPNYAHPLVRTFIQRFDAGTFESHNLSIMNKSALRKAMKAASLKNLSIGSAGGPRFRPDVASDALIPRSCQLMARVWNSSVAQLPIGWAMWQAEFWGIGKATENVR